MESLKQMQKTAAAEAEAVHAARVRERHVTFEKAHYVGAAYNKDTDSFIGGEIRAETFSDVELAAVIKTLSLSKKTETASVDPDIVNADAISDMLSYVLGRAHGSKTMKSEVLAACKAEAAQRKARAEGR